MPSTALTISPCLSNFLGSLKGNSANASVDHLISLLKRRQIQNARPCAIATTHLLLRVVAESKFKAVSQLIDRIRDIGFRLCEAQPRELTIGNVVRRVLGLIREITESSEDLISNGIEEPQKATPMNTQSSVLPDSLFTLMSNPALITAGESARPPSEDTNSMKIEGQMTMRDVKDDALNGIREMLDELEQADEQIAGYALEHIHPNEIILTTTASVTIQKFLLSAAKRRRFTVIFVESYPNEHTETHQMAINGKKKNSFDGGGGGGDDNSHRYKSLTSAGIKVMVIPDSNIWTVMAKVDQVFLAAHSVFSNGACITSAGARMIAKAAQMQKVPVTILSGVYRFSPVFSRNTDDSIECGDPAKVLGFQEGSMIENIDIINPLQDHISPDLVSLYISNLGGHSPSNVYRIVADHYHEDDIDL